MPGSLPFRGLIPHPTPTPPARTPVLLLPQTASPVISISDYHPSFEPRLSAMPPPASIPQESIHRGVQSLHPTSSPPHLPPQSAEMPRLMVSPKLTPGQCLPSSVSLIYAWGKPNPASALLPQPLPGSCRQRANSWEGVSMMRALAQALAPSDSITQQSGCCCENVL